MPVLEKYKTFAFVLIIAIIGGAAGVLFKIGLGELSPELFTFLRFIFALVAFLPFFFKKSETVLPSPRRLILISFIATLNVVFFIFGLQYTTAIISSMLYAAAPLVVGIFSWKIIKENISFNKWLGIIVGFVGLLVIILSPKLGDASIWNGSLLGNFMIGLAVIFLSLYSVLSKKYESIYSPAVLTKYFVITTIVTQAVLLSFNPSSIFDQIEHISPKVWIILAYAGILDTALYYFLYQYVIKRATPIIASMVFYLQPIVTIILGYLILDEKMTSLFIAGGVLIFIGITLVFREKYFQVYSI